MNKNGPDDPATPGEFTRLFRDLDTPEPKPAVTPNPPAATPASSEQAVTRPMTRLFSAKAQPQRPERASNVAPLESKPAAGEFTQLFRPAEPAHPPPPAERPPQHPAQAGEFTRMFSVPPPARTEPVSRTPPPAEAGFTELFNALQFPGPEKEVNWRELESNRIPQVNKTPGEFTPEFGRSKMPIDEPPRPAPSARGVPEEGPFSKTAGGSFEADVHSDEFARIINQARQRSGAQGQPPGVAPASMSQQAQAKVEPPAKRAPQLWLLVVAIAVVLILASGAVYLFVLRG
jgi:hypothetical protein